MFRLEDFGGGHLVWSPVFLYSVFPIIVDRTLPEGEGPEEEKASFLSICLALLYESKLLSLILPVQN